METKLSPADLVTDLSDVLDRVHGRGERFVIERDGETVAVLAPAPPPTSMTWGEFVALLRDLPQPDDRFADDLAEIKATQGVATVPLWPD